MFKYFLLAFFAAAMISCSDNLFGSGNSDGDAKSLRIDAENAFRAGKYEKAYNIYSEIVKKDSTASVGYFGMAKAGLWMKGVNPFDLLGFVKVEDGQIPFSGDSARVQNKYLQGMKVAEKPLAILERRDTLTALYEFHKKDSLSLATNGTGIDTLKKDDSLRVRVAKFRAVFCNNDAKGLCSDTVAGAPIGKRFPLSDREYKHNSFSGGYTVSSLLTTLLTFIDMNHDGCISTRQSNPDGKETENKDSTKWVVWGCSANKSGRFNYDVSLNLSTNEDGKIEIDTKQIYEDMLADFLDEQNACIADPSCTPQPPDSQSTAGGLNSNIDDFDGSLDQVGDMLNNLSGLGGGSVNCDDYLNEGSSSDCSTSGMQDNIQDQLDQYKGFAPFYKIADRIDNDGDGCVDEELVDGWDSDGDGVKDEDSRLTSLDWTNPFVGRDGVDNDMNGIIDDEGELPNFYIVLKETEEVLIKITPPYPTNPDLSSLNIYAPEALDTLITVGFAEAPDWKNSQDIDLKLKVAKDKLGTKYSLEARKELIGGCWKNYDAAKFNQWINQHKNLE